MATQNLRISQKIETNLNWVLNNEMFACIVEYYKNDPGRDGVKCYWPEDDCDSEDPWDKWEWVGTRKEELLQQGKKLG